jgi:hypothetical protein
MSKLPSIALAATLLSVGIPDAQAKQRCRDAAPSNKQGEWWSYRLIDGRKCWYQGKPGLSKALLEWPKVASARRPVTIEKVSDTVTEKPGNPLDAQALMDAGTRALRDSNSFEALWRERADLQ